MKKIVGIVILLGIDILLIVLIVSYGAKRLKSLTSLKSGNGATIGIIENKKILTEHKEYYCSHVKFKKNYVIETVTYIFYPTSYVFEIFWLDDKENKHKLLLYTQWKWIYDAHEIGEKLDFKKTYNYHLSWNENQFFSKIRLNRYKSEVSKKYKLKED